MYESGSFGDIKAFLIEMLETYHYEETLLSSTVDLVRYDLYQQVKKRRKTTGKGIACRDVSCDLCHSHLALKNGHVVAFHCNHKYHVECLKQASCVFVTNLGEEKMHCYKCVTKNLRSTAATSLSSAKLLFQSSSKEKLDLNQDELELLLACEIFGQEHGFGYIKGFGLFWFDGRSTY